MDEHRDEALDEQLIDEAAQTARQAAQAARVEVADVHDPAALRAVSQLLDEVWGRTPPSTGIGLELLTALAHAGNQVSVARRDDELLGATVAFLGRDEAGNLLHSHVTGVRTPAEGAGIGRALKWHQRAWCLQRGIARVGWTFDPLVRRNAVFNLLVLAARVRSYAPDLYGPMADARNAGLPTDRLVVDWQLDAPRVRAAAAGRAAAPDPAALQRAGAEVALDEDPDGAPVSHPTDAVRRLVRAPSDIEQLRQRDPELARAWSTAMRTALGDPLSEGWQVTGGTREGWLVLSADRGVAELRARP